MTTIKNLVLSGGGVLGISYVSSLRVLDEHGILKNIQKYAGVSVGSILIGALACGASIDYLEKVFKMVDFNNFRDENNILFKISGFFKRFGYYRGDKLMKWYRSIIQELTSNGDITLGEIYQKYGKEIVIVATNVDKRKSEYFTTKTHPEMSLVQAVRISASYPFFFETVKYNNDIYIDGGLLNNYPISIFDNESEFSETLGLKLTTSSDLEHINNPIDRPPKSTSDYIFTIVQMLLSLALRTHIDTVDLKRTVMINTKTISSMNFNITEQDKEFLIQQGRLDTERFLQTLS